MSFSSSSRTNNSHAPGHDLNPYQQINFNN
jgi:hypothetical protein